MPPKCSNEYVVANAMHESSRELPFKRSRKRELPFKRSRKRELPRLACALWLAALFAIAASGCATVAPYERERLAKRDMQMERNGDANAGEEHATAYREGSSGGGSSSGGGCGCN